MKPFQIANMFSSKMAKKNPQKNKKYFLVEIAW